jgi:hypothetical protein
VRRGSVQVPPGSSGNHYRAPVDHAAAKKPSDPADFNDRRLSGSARVKGAGTSALVVRSDPEQFSGGTDSFDFSGLNAGWTVESIQLLDYRVSCPGDITSARSFGNWKTSWADRGFAVTWASNTCTSYIPPVSSFALSSSEYAIKVWVIGPAGTQPQF